MTLALALITLFLFLVLEEFRYALVTLVKSAVFVIGLVVVIPYAFWKSL
jgi:hypothetical protein